MKLPSILFVLFLPLLTMGQTKHRTKSYNIYKMQNSTPPYGLAKVEEPIDNARPGTTGNDTMSWSKLFALSDKDYKALSLRGKFTYHMLHGESFSQNCNLASSIWDNAITGYLPDAFGLRQWSGRQTEFLVSNRDSVMKLIRESADSEQLLGLNYKQAIVEIKGWE